MTLHEMTNLHQGETWLAIPGFDGYEVSDMGRVRSFRQQGTRKLRKTSRLKKASPASNGYLSVTLQKPNQSGCSKYSVHTLVAAAFLGPRPAGFQVAHSDGNRLNAKLSNLRYATASENADDKRRHGTDTPGERNGTHKLTEGDIREIRSLRDQGLLQRELAVKFGVSRSAIQFVTSGQRWAHVEGKAS